MKFSEVLDQTVNLLRCRGRVSYRALKRAFNLDEAFLEDLKAEIISTPYLAVDEPGTGLVRRGETRTPAVLSQEVSCIPGECRTTAARFSEAERRQLTVLFCDLVGSTALASQLDLEEWRAVVQAYQATCAKVIARFGGHIAQYLGDGLLVYFGYPLAHEDDAQRAVRTGLGMVEALGPLNTHLLQEYGIQLAARLGIHTGLVVVGNIGEGARQEQLALGEPPHIAARLQGLAAPNTVVISAATWSLLGGFFACQKIDSLLPKGLTQSLAVYQVLCESTARSRLDVAASTGLSAMVGRQQEVKLLLESWEQVKHGHGQVVLLSGEAGIGKSRLVQVLKAHLASEPQAWLTPCQCSPYYQNSALYPMIDLLERVALRFDRAESPQQKLSKLEGHLVQYDLPLAEAVPLFAALLSLPLPADYVPLTMSAEQQKHKTLQAFLSIFLKIAMQQPVLFVMEDLHWVDPSTLELLSLLIEHVPTAGILVLLTYRPDFSPPWGKRSHLTHLTLERLTRQQAAQMTDLTAHGKALPPEVVQQVVDKTDGVPLFVEELTKMILESGLLQEQEDHYTLTGPLPPLAIPATLHDSLMARLDRLAAVKGIAQLGATLGREFSYALLHAVSPWDEATLQQGLQQLVAAEFLYQQDLPPHARYRFKHALIQEAASQSLLKSIRQHYHQRIAQTLAERFLDITVSQPELLAYHYTEAGLHAPAIDYWQRAGQHAVRRSTYVEAINHLRQGLRLLVALPDTSERVQHEIHLQATLGSALMATRGYAAPEVEQVYTRVHALCQQVGDTPQFFPELFGLWRFYVVRAELQTASALAGQLLTSAQQQHDPALLTGAHWALGATSFYLGEFVPARPHLEQAIVLHKPQRRRSQAFLHAADPGVVCRSYMAWVLWLRGYPDQALQQSLAAITLAQGLSHPYSLAWALCFAATLLHFRRQGQAVQEQAEAAIALSNEQKFPLFLSIATILQGWGLTLHGQGGESLAQIQQGVTTLRTLGVQALLPCFLTILAEAYGQAGQTDVGLTALTELLEMVQTRQLRWWEAELYRHQGELLLARTTQGHGCEEAAACFQQAITVARRQQARSLELRAVMSLSRVWRRQGKRQAARRLLEEIYGWFSEGFDTADLREARALLEQL